MGARARLLLSATAVLVVAAAVYAPLARCADACFVDYAAVFDDTLARTGVTDARLNAWILAWVERSLLTDPSALFDGNIFYPARNAIAASEHLIGVALPLLPVAALGGGAVLLHQIALLLSAAVFGISTFLFVRWLTGADGASMLAAAIAVLMPWRLTELPHIQLLWCSWFPLVWMGVGRVGATDGRLRHALALALVTALQLLSSFYLAYHLTLSLAILIPALLASGHIERRAIPRLAGALAIPYALLVVSAIPYLAWRSASGFVAAEPVLASASPALLWSAVAPSLDFGLRDALPRRVSYELPLAAAILALVALAPCAAGEERGRRARAFALALTGVVAAAAVLALGRRLEVFGVAIPLPGDILARVVPGFENLRNPLRWLIVPGVALPTLAGVGAWRLDRWVSARLPSRGRGGILTALRAAAVLLVLLNLPIPTLAVREAFAGHESRRAADEALATLPPGPVMELPWSMLEVHDTGAATLAMLASTDHWHPLLNGSSGYAPPSYALLRQLAQRLPHADGFERLEPWVDLRWIVLHTETETSRDRRLWSEAERAGRIRQVFADAATRIYEVTTWPDSGTRSESLLAPARSGETMTGIPRTALDVPPGAVGFAANAPRRYRHAGERAFARLVSFRIENRSAAPWPGLDPDPNGLVQLQYTFEDVAAPFSATGGIPLALDIPARSAVTGYVPLVPPARDGRYRLRLELAQRIDGALRPLGGPTVVEEVRVIPDSSDGADREGER